ncbi:Outer membrane receptor proteins, mostly Fe transport [Hymenobacter gelipurpurascens]|uniref:Outer membrane receptor proteins, mostly Fe transport n=1 Tax=Hymenobacter gelipurpurascens TaxID=89968 RepID=A0A212TE02_9BACT|nr:TonB-dependent receptor [Hymenobacter gelipurpurascens]SNC64090.1 Outer membrane receptor proteins, mostly Fe transport [Hymenobacter gelipurpurascens]
MKSPALGLLPWPLSFLFLLGLSSAAQAQTQTASSLSGSIKTQAGAPIEYATVVLHRATDSTVVKSEFSDEKGLFRIEQAAAGRYLLSASQVGFVRTWSKPFELPAASASPLALTLQASGATNLKEVQVIGQKPLYEREADRTIVNVEGSTLAAGNTSLDVLRRAPGVTIDGNDNLALRGKQGLLVLIDGKRQPMTGTELADYLRALPADQLKNIELITNPPAKYDAQGGAGIIAINLKKDQRQGTNGSINSSYGRSFYGGKFTSGISLNHRNKGLNVFGSYTYSERQMQPQLTISRDFFAVSDQGGNPVTRTFTGSSQQHTVMQPHGRSHTAKVGLDYTLSERTVVGVALNGLTNRIPQNGTNFTQLFDAQGGLQETYRSTNTRALKAPNGAVNLNFKHTFPAPDSGGARELTADVDYARYIADRAQNLTTRFESNRPTFILRGDQEGDLTIKSAKADYVQTLSKQLRLEAGAKVSQVYSDNDVVFINNLGRGGLDSVDVGKTNRFRYDENISAAYGTLTFTPQPGLTLTGGLRGEQTSATGRQSVGNEDFDRNYFQLFPSAALKRELSKDHELSVSLSRRIDRPSYNQLNPFRVYIDATTYNSGNPNLRPQTSYNAELTHTFKQKYTTGLSYTNTHLPIIQVVQPAPASEGSQQVVSTSVNLQTQHYYALTLTVPLEPVKDLSIYNNAVLYYSRFEGNLAGTSLNRGRTAFNLSSNTTYKFGKDWTVELNGSYQSREVYGFLDVRPYGEVTAGVQKGLWDRKATLKLNMSDIFFTSPIRATSAYTNYVENFYQRIDSRVLTLSFSYRFGNDKLSPTRRRSGGAEDEKRRAG